MVVCASVSVMVCYRVGETEGNVGVCLCQPHHHPYFSAFPAVRLTVHVFTAPVCSGRSAEPILNRLQYKITNLSIV